MSTKFKSQMKEVMQMAWSFVRKNGYSMSEALKCAWANFKLKGNFLFLIPLCIHSCCNFAFRGEFCEYPFHNRVS